MSFLATLAQGSESLGKLDAWVVLITTVASAIVMIVGPMLVYFRLKGKDQGFGPNGIRAIGILLFIPTVLILALQKKLQGETLAALLGTELAMCYRT